MTVDRELVAGWLDRYVRAWTSRAPEDIGDLFTDDARYRYRPDSAPIVGRAAIVASWLEIEDPPGSYDAHYEPGPVGEGGRAVALGHTLYRNPDGTTRTVFDNCFLLTLDDQGRCSDFTEFFMERPTDPHDVA